jgi:hypothetical protein
MRDCARRSAPQGIISRRPRSQVCCVALALLQFSLDTACALGKIVDSPKIPAIGGWYPAVFVQGCGQFVAWPLNPHGGELSASGDYLSEPLPGTAEYPRCLRISPLRRVPFQCYAAAIFRVRDFGMARKCNSNGSDGMCPMSDAHLTGRRLFRPNPTRR